MVEWQPGITYSRFHLGLAIGDVVVVTLLISVGLLSHDTNPLTNLQSTVLTALPFLVGWVGGSFFSGLYRYDTISSYTETVSRSAGSWIVAALVGSGLRATEVVPGTAPPLFVLVMTGTGLVALVSWRLFVTFLVTLRTTGGR